MKTLQEHINDYINRGENSGTSMRACEQCDVDIAPIPRGYLVCRKCYIENVEVNLNKQGEQNEN